MSESSTDSRCGYLHQKSGFCCWRDRWAGYDRCFWHAEATEDKTAEDVKQAIKAEPDSAVIDGAILDGVDFPDQIDCTDWSFRDSSLRGATLPPEPEQCLFAEADFTEAQLTNAEFQQGVFTGAKFDNTILESIRLDGAELSNTEFQDIENGTRFSAKDANLVDGEVTDSMFTECNFQGSNLSGISCVNVDFSAAPGWSTFQGATMTDADFIDVTFTEADLTDITVSQKTSFEDSILTGCTLRNVSLFGENLSSVDDASELIAPQIDIQNETTIRDADLGGQLDEGTFDSVSFEAVRFKGGSIAGSSFDQATLDDVIFEDIDCSEIDFTQIASDPDSFMFEGDVSLKRANLAGLSLNGYKFDGMDLTGANLSNCRLRDASFEGTIVEQADLSESVLLGAALEGAYLFGANLANVRIDRETFGLNNSVSNLYIPYDPLFSGHTGHCDGLTEEEQYRRAAGTYRMLEQVFRENAYPSAQSRVFVNRKRMQRALNWQEGGVGAFRSVIGSLSYILMQHGENPYQLVAWMGVVIVLPALAYTAGFAQFGDGTALGIADGLDGLYYSILTFFGLGMDAIEPSGGAGRFVVSMQAVLGPLLIALLVFSVTRKASR